jgi:hypothetical protein
MAENQILKALFNESHTEKRKEKNRNQIGQFIGVRINKPFCNHHRNGDKNPINRRGTAKIK